MRIPGLVALTLLCLQDPKAKLKQALKDDCSPTWIYDDLAFGFAEAKKSGRPLLVVFR